MVRCDLLDAPWSRNVASGVLRIRRATLVAAALASAAFATPIGEARADEMDPTPERLVETAKTLLGKR